MKDANRDRSNERGSAGVKFMLVLTVIALVANAGYNYVPVAYQGASMKGDMEGAVLQGLAMPGKLNPVDNVKTRVQQAMTSNQLPPDAQMAVTQQGNVIQARVVYNKAVAILPFGIYTYQYKFDQTATPTGFLLKQ